MFHVDEFICKGGGRMGRGESSAIPAGSYKEILAFLQ